MKTSKMTKVLISLDWDPTAKKVVETGFSLAKAMGAEIILLHVISDPKLYASPNPFTVMGFAGYQYVNPLQSASHINLVKEDELKTAALKFLDNFKRHLGDDTIQTIVKTGDSAESILLVANKVKADVIVLGSHSKKWLHNIVMGSVTKKVLNHALKPVLIVPTKKQ
jgi:nucleotide-binding universal stress UspA family protein